MLALLCQELRRRDAHEESSQSEPEGESGVARAETKNPKARRTQTKSKTLNN